MSWLDYLAPLRCVCCGRVGYSWCPGCRGPGRPEFGVLPNGAEVLLGGRYEGALKTALRAWKLGARRDLLQPLAQQLVPVISSLASQPLALAPIPVRRSSRRRRGQDLIAELAGAICREIGGELVISPVLRWAREPSEQVGQDFTQRRANLAGAIRCVSGPDLPPTVIALDDITTSGATLTSATDALRGIGVGRVLAAAVAGASC